MTLNPPLVKVTSLNAPAAGVPPLMGPVMKPSLVLNSVEIVWAEATALNSEATAKTAMNLEIFMVCCLLEWTGFLFAVGGIADRPVIDYP